MPANWVIFIPRDRTQAKLLDETGGPSLVDQADKWRSHVTSKGAGQKYNFHIVCKGEQLSVALADDDVVYVYGGHGLSNQDFVSWPGNTKNPISSSDMAEIVSGLVPTAFNGRLKVYSCYSGDSGETAFAKRLTDKLRTKSYTCPVFGFKGQVTQAYETLKPLVKTQLRMKSEAPEGTYDGAHRWSVMGDVGRAMYQGRAKNDRVKF